jgi:sugar lactone lactonase YvrE
MRIGWKVVTGLAVAGATRAQTPAGIAAVDSAGVARVAWSRAATALRDHNANAARAEVDHAANAWPTQAAYLWASATLAARAGDTARLRDMLASLAAMGLGRDLHRDTSFARYLQLPTIAPLIVTLSAQAMSEARSNVQATLSDSTFWPEGVDYDSRTGRFYVASIRHRTVAEVIPGKPARELWTRDKPDMGAVYGVRIDAARGLLWATMSAPRRIAGDAAGDSTIAALIRVRLRDGAIERRWNVASPGPHTLGDLAIGPGGDVFVTDSDQPVLYRLRSGGDTLERITHPLFRSLQGMAPSPDGRVVYVADYSHGILRVDLATSAVARLDDAPHSTSLGCDGIVWHRGAIIAVQNGVSPARIMRFVLDSSGRRIVRAEVLDRNSAIADEPTIGTVAGGEFVYVANSQWEKFAESGSRKSDVRLTMPILLAVPLPP